jgi:hypothetical protein
MRPGRGAFAKFLMSKVAERALKFLLLPVENCYAILFSLYGLPALIWLNHAKKIVR